MADRGQGWVARTAWVLATVILAVGVGLWVNFWLPWWVGAAIGIPIAVVFLNYAFDEISGRLNPTPAGALEISQWWSFAGSIRDGLVSPSLDPSQPDPMLPYAVALNVARQWITNSNALPPWFLPDGPREQTRRGLRKNPPLSGTGGHSFLRANYREAGVVPAVTPPVTPPASAWSRLRNFPTHYASPPGS